MPNWINYSINENIRYSILLLTIATLMSGIFLVSSYSRPIVSDEVQYEILGWNIAAGHGYSLSLSAPYEPTALREPGYPLFIALIYKIFGREYIYIYMGQIILFCTSCILVFKICKEIFGLQVAKYSSLLTAICPTLANYSVIFYSEIFFIFLLCLNIYFIILAKRIGNAKLFIAVGITSGLMVLVKTVMIFSPFIAGIYFFLGRNRNFKMVSYARNIILSVFILVIILTPWFLRNYHLFGIKNLASSRAEIILLSRALKTDYSFEKIKMAYVYGFSEYLGSRFFPDAIEKARDFLLDDDHVAFKMEKDLLRQGYTQKEVSSMLKKEAMTKIKRHPFKYILQTPFEFFKMLSFMHIPLLNDTHIINKFKDINYGLIILSSLRGIYKATGYFIILLAGIGIYIKRKEWIQHFIPLALILYINLFHSFLYGYARYAVPLIPFYFMYMIIGIFTILDKMNFKFFKVGENE